MRASETLKAFRRALAVTSSIGSEASWYLFVLKPGQETLTASSYPANALKQATENYLSWEKQFAGTAGDAVLVRSDSLKSLRRAFPNYFLDTGAFVKGLNQLLAS